MILQDFGVTCHCYRSFASASAIATRWAANKSSCQQIPETEWRETKLRAGVPKESGGRSTQERVRSGTINRRTSSVLDSTSTAELSVQLWPVNETRMIPVPSFPLPELYKVLEGD